ncbi:MAG: DNA translocase FtsK 4TM domain-containing protein [Actinomycetota bacterium]|nr:DNA translocase FtsK 4TM domain-containing protein [Actinomycetota bacterium]
MANSRRTSPPSQGKNKTRTRHATVTPETLWSRHQRDIWIVLMILAGLLILLAEINALGLAGRGVNEGLKATFGVGRVAVPVLLIGLGVVLVTGRVQVERARFLWAVSLALVAVSGMGDIAQGRPSLRAPLAELGRAGGWLGVAVGGSLARFIGPGGAVAALLAVLIIAVMIGTSVGLRSLFASSGAVFSYLGRHFATWWSARPTTTNYEPDGVPEIEVIRTTDTPPRRRRTSDPQPDDEGVHVEAVTVGFTDGDDVEEEGDRDVEAYQEEPEEVPRPAFYFGTKESHWELPPMSLLSRTRELRQDRDAIEAAGEELVSALGAHGVETTLVGFTMGPTVTRFELELGAGVKVSRVTSLNKDIAYAMASPDVRILAPIPGRSAIGVEVPNRQRALVALGDLLASDEAVAATHPLDVPIGRDISGKTVVVNLGEMPHVLISGATGAGKSSCINSLITSLVMRATPDQVKLLLVDPKRVEMGNYNDLPHLLAPVVVDPKKAAGALAWAVKEMERRYDVLAENGARDITGYQQMLARGAVELEATTEELVGEAIERSTSFDAGVNAREPEVLPYIVIVVDELNDLMMVAARDVEESVVRIAQMARAVGIHLVLATQRPSVDVITGVIKANVPSRMAFAVSSLADSRVILDQAGAERLIGKGDMLLVTASSNIARRLQSPWVSEDEVRRVVENWRAQGGQRETVVALDIPAGRSESATGSGDDDDEILRQAREIVIRNQSGSTSMLQRKLRVGFARAGRLMDQLEIEGVVGPGDGSKARKVLISRDELDETQ